MIAVNGRFLSQSPTGIQRFAMETTIRLSGHIVIFSPVKHPGISDIKGNHIDIRRPAFNFDGVARAMLWEQAYLPLRLSNQVLYCPNPSVPIAYKKKAAIVIHDVAIIDNPNWYSYSRRQYYIWLWRAVVKWGRPIITVSNFTKERICDVLGAKPDNVFVSNNAVDKSKFRRRDEFEVEVVLRKYGLRKGGFFISVGVSSPRKNITSIIEAMLLRDLGVDLVIIGPTTLPDAGIWDKSELARNFIKCLGWISDDELICLYSSAIAFVYPSLYEGFGIPILEAMSCGCPVVASNCTAIPEVAGGAALLVDSNSKESVADGLRRAIEDTDLIRRNITLGYQRIDSYTWDTAAKVVGDALTY